MRAPALPVSLATLLGIFTLAMPSGSLAKGKIEKRSYEFEEAGKEMEYQLYVPGGYRKAEKHPLVVVLHGLGSNPNQVIRYAGITKEAEARGYIVVAPYGYNSRGWYGSMGKGKPRGKFLGNVDSDPENLGELSEKDVMNVLGIVREEFNIDDDRIYLMGHSMGGGGTVHLGTKYPDIWAGLAPLSPALIGHPSILEKAKHLPVMVVTGEKDKLVRVADVRRWVEKMKELEMDHVYNEIAGGNHYNTITHNPEMMAGVFDFFDEKRRPGEEAEPVSTGGEFRIFTNQAGRKITAKLVAVDGDKVTIVRKDGRQFTLKTESLSDGDQEFVKQQAGE